MLGAIASALGGLYRASFAAALRRVYLGGPGSRSLGFWGGLPEVDICARISGVEASFWTQQRNECSAIVDRDVQAFVITVEAAAQLIAWI